MGVVLANGMVKKRDTIAIELPPESYIKLERV